MLAGEGVLGCIFWAVQIMTVLTNRKIKWVKCIKMFLGRFYLFLDLLRHKSYYGKKSSILMAGACVFGFVFAEHRAEFFEGAKAFALEHGLSDEASSLVTPDAVEEKFGWHMMSQCQFKSQLCIRICCCCWTSLAPMLWVVEMLHCSLAPDRKFWSISADESERFLLQCSLKVVWKDVFRTFGLFWDSSRGVEILARVPQKHLFLLWQAKWIGPNGLQMLLF